MVQNVSYMGVGMVSLLGANSKHGGSGEVCWTAGEAVSLGQNLFSWFFFQWNLANDANEARVFLE